MLNPDPYPDSMNPDLQHLPETARNEVQALQFQERFFAVSVKVELPIINKIVKQNPRTHCGKPWFVPISVVNKLHLAIIFTVPFLKKYRYKIIKSYCSEFLN
jgi:hypothetical protein